jgi:hypothetical protein
MQQVATEEEAIAGTIRDLQASLPTWRVLCLQLVVVFAFICWVVHHLGRHPIPAIVVVAEEEKKKQQAPLAYPWCQYRVVVAIDAEFTGNEAMRHHVSELGLCAYDVVGDRILYSARSPVIPMPSYKEWDPKCKDFWTKSMSAKLEELERISGLEVPTGGKWLNDQLFLLRGILSKAGIDEKDVYFLSDTNGADIIHISSILSGWMVNIFKYWGDREYRGWLSMDSPVDSIRRDLAVNGDRWVEADELPTRLYQHPQNGDPHNPEADAIYIARCWSFYVHYLSRRGRT